MRKGLKISLAIAISCIIIGSATFYIIRNVHDDDNSDSNYHNSIKFYGDQNTFYINKSLLKNANENIPYYFEVKENTPEWNQTNLSYLSKKFLTNPHLSSSSDVDRMYTNNLSERLVIEIGGTISYYKKIDDIISKEKLLSDDSLKETALKYIKDKRGKTSDLKYEFKMTSSVYKGDSKTKTETYMGYNYQKIVFRQYIDGFKVAGTRGSVILNIGEGGVIEYYEDDTIDINLTSKIEYKYKIENLTSVLSRLSNVNIYDGEKTFEIIGYNLILHAYDYYSESVELKWEIELKPEDGDNFNYIL